MRFERTIHKSTPEECAAILPLLTDPPPFASFVLSGNDDAPSRLDLYALAKPEYNHRAVAVYERRDGGYVRVDAPAAKPKAGVTIAEAVKEAMTPAPPELDKETEKMLEPSSIDNPLPFPATASQVAAAAKPLTLSERLKLKGLK